jgi:hypothetical protein
MATRPEVNAIPRGAGMARSEKLCCFMWCALTLEGVLAAWLSSSSRNTDSPDKSTDARLRARSSEPWTGGVRPAALAAPREWSARLADAGRESPPEPGASLVRSAYEFCVEPPSPSVVVTVGGAYALWATDGQPGGGWLGAPRIGAKQRSSQAAARRTLFLSAALSLRRIHLSR